MPYLRNWWDLDGQFPGSDEEVLLGSDAAAKLHLDPGDSIDISGQQRTVSGVLHATGSQDDQVIMASLSWTEQILGQEGQVSLIDVSALCSDCPIDELVTQISGVLPHADVKALRQVMDQRMQLVERFRRFALTLAGVIALLSGVLTFAVMTASVAERRREIGIFRALGFSRQNILRIIQSETLIISAAAGVLGIAVTLLASYTILPSLTGLAPEQIFLKPLLPLSGFFLLPLLALGASWIPARRASAIDPVESISSL